MKNRLYLFITIILLFTSCDCFVRIDGIVYDKATNKPIENAIIEVGANSKQLTSNQNGFFEFSRHSGFCKDIELKISKMGYKPFGLKIKRNSSETDFSIKSEFEYVDLEKPFYPDTNDKSTFHVSFSLQKWSQDLSISDTLKFYLSRAEKEIEIQNIRNNLRGK